jgi:hypothetical protein
MNQSTAFLHAEVTSAINASAIAVHKELGPGYLEVKAIEAIHEAHLAVALAYLKATGLKVGLIVNFGGSVMRSRRVFEPALGSPKQALLIEGRPKVAP